MKRVAVVGASNDRSKFGNKAVRAYRMQGLEVLPVNPREESIEGLRCYPDVCKIEGDLDLVSVYVRPEILDGLLDGIAAKGNPELWLNPGSESEQVISKAEDLGLQTIQACSIVGLGLSPNVL